MTTAPSAAEAPPSPLSRTALRAKRLKPAPGQLPVATVYSRRRRARIELYDPAGCVPMRAKREITEAQRAALAAGRQLHTHAPCASCGATLPRSELDADRRCDACLVAEWEEDCRLREARRIAGLAELTERAHASQRPVFLDTETTGLEVDDELLEVGIVDSQGRVLFESLVRPLHRTEWPEAQEIHGIAPAAVATAPTITELLPMLAEILGQADLVVAYNARFDERFLPLALRHVLHGRLVCAMEAFALHAAIWRDDIEDYRCHRLQAAAASAGHLWTARHHRAIADALACRAVWHHVTGQPDAGAELSTRAA